MPQLKEKPREIALFLATFATFAAITLGRNQAIVADEVGFIGLARYISGTREMFHMLTVSYYSWGYPLFLAPIYWITQSPDSSYRLGVLLNAVFVAAMAVMLARLFGLLCTVRPRDRYICVALIILYPAVQLNAGILWSETAFACAFTLLVLQAAQLASRWSMLRAHLFCVLSVYLFAIHQRALLLPLAAYMYVAYLIFRYRYPKIALTTCLASTTTAFVLVYLLNRHFQSVGWDAGYSNPMLSRATGALTLGALLGLLKTAVGQLWYLGFATLGLFYAALIALVVKSWCLVGGVFHAGYPQSGEPEAVQERVSSDLALFILAAFGCVFAASVAAMSLPVRTDHFIYGRYLEGVMPPVLLVGILALRKWSLDPVWRLGVLAVVCVFTTVAALLLNHFLPLSQKLAYVGWTVPATLVLHTGHRLETIISIGTDLALLVFALALLLCRWNWRIALIPFFLVFAVSGVVASRESQREGMRASGAYSLFQKTAEAYGTAKVKFVGDALPLGAYLMLQAYLPNWNVSFVREGTPDEVRGADFVFADRAWRERNQGIDAFELGIAGNVPQALWRLGEIEGFLSGHRTAAGENLIPVGPPQSWSLLRGLYPLERTGDESWRWTNGDGSIVLRPDTAVCGLDLSLLSLSPVIQRAVVKIDGGSEVAVTLPVNVRQSIALPLSGSDKEIRLSVSSDTFIPGNGAGTDTRRLGVQIRSLSLEACHPRKEEVR